MKKKWSKSWKGSRKRSKQRKYFFNSPLHIKQKMLNSPLSKELKAKYKKNSAGIKTGDKVKIMRGSFKGKTGKVEDVNHKRIKVYITGIDSTKKDGAKRMMPIHPSNLMITELNVSDKKRENTLSRAIKK